MPKEYEYSFKKFNRAKILSKLVELNAIYGGTFLFKVQQFNPPQHLPYNINIRVRDEGYRVTMTIKTPTKDFDNEEEVIINSFDYGVNYLLRLGCTKSVYYEKVREIWILPNFENLFAKKYTEIVFDTEAGLPDIMEIESPTFEELQMVVHLFGLNKKNIFITLFENIFNW
jgi:hypothetical protein